MSIKAGKAKNWGSRSGKTSTKKGALTLADHLALAGIPDHILRELADPETSKKAAQEVISRREAIRKGHGAAKVVFKTRLGELFQGDCLKALDHVADESVDCVFADPPFNLSKEYGNGRSDALAEEEYLEWTRAWLDRSVAKLKTGGSLFVYNIPKWATHIAEYLSRHPALSFKHWIAVDMTFSLPIPGRLYPSHYALLYFVKGDKPSTFTPPRTAMETCPGCGKELHDYGGYKSKMNPNGLNLRDVWKDIPPVRHAKYKNRDANELSIKLLDRIIDLSTKEGDTVLDPFGGSGTTYAVAELKKRHWVGVELGDCTAIMDRLENLDDDKKALARYRDGVNLLFTDRALELRKKSGLPLHHYRIYDDQLARVFGKTKPTLPGI